MVITCNATTAHGTRINSSSLAIVELALEELPTDGSPGAVLHQYLQASFASNSDGLKYLKQTFSVDPDSLENHRQKMSSVVTALKE